MSKGWPLVKLGEVLTERQETPDLVDLQKGTTKIISKISFNTGKIDFRSESQTKTGLILIRPGDLVISGINAAKGAIAIYSEKQSNTAAATIHYGAYEVNCERANLNFLWWLLRSKSFKEILNKNLPGGIKTELKAKRLLHIKIPLPPLAEQKRIVEKIERLAGKIEEARSLAQKSEVEAEMLLKRISIDYLKIETENIIKKPLRELVSIVGGGTPSKSNPTYWEGSIPWVTPKDMKVRELYKTIDHISESATQETSAKTIEKGAVLVVVRGMILAHTFPSAVLKVTAAINQDMKALIPCQSILPEFLCLLFWLSNYSIVNLVEKSTHDTRKLRTEKLLDIQIPIFSLEKQTDIIEKVEKLNVNIDHIRIIKSQTTADLDALLSSILDKAFKGEL